MMWFDKLIRVLLKLRTVLRDPKSGGAVVVIMGDGNKVTFNAQEGSLQQDQEPNVSRSPSSQSLLDTTWDPPSLPFERSYLEGLHEGLFGYLPTDTDSDDEEEEEE